MNAFTWHEDLYDSLLYRSCRNQSIAATLSTTHVDVLVPTMFWRSESHVP